MNSIDDEMPVEIVAYKTPGGKHANDVGNSQEFKIMNFLYELQKKGYTFTANFYYDANHKRVRRKEVSVCNSIYGDEKYPCPLYIDFIIKGIPGFPNGLILESKVQTVAGSGDEKFPYLIANIKEKMPCPCIVILTLSARDGQSCGLQDRFDAIKRWFKKQVDGKKLIGVMDMTTFENWFLIQIGEHV